MSSIAFLEGFYYVPRIDKELLEAHSEGLICLSGCLAGRVQRVHPQGPARRRRRSWRSGSRKVFGDDFYVEIQNNGLDIQDQCTPVAADIANKLGVPLVATGDAHYLLPGRRRRPRRAVLHQHRQEARPAEEAVPRRADAEPVLRPHARRTCTGCSPSYADAVARSQEIADGVRHRARLQEAALPGLHAAGGQDARRVPARAVRAGAAASATATSPPKAVRDRLEHELGIICRMGFASYFLIVWDFVRFAREKGIPCTARGSACGALVSYVLYLSHVDPLEYDLLFERFLDPNRTEAPDIDIDFCQDRREEVIDYVKREVRRGVSVAQIGTFGTLAAKAAHQGRRPRARRPARARQPADASWCRRRRSASTLDEALAESPDFKREYDSDPQVRELIDIARKLEGTNRNAGTHAAGVVIANGPITDYVPVQRVVRKGDDGGGRSGEAVVTTQWVMGDLEKVGLLKMDFLGLRNADAPRQRACKLIKRTRGDDIDLHEAPARRRRDVRAACSAATPRACSSSNRDGIRELLKRMKPDNIRDLIAVLGPLPPRPARGRHGGRVRRTASTAARSRATRTRSWRRCWSETYGVMVYQEQIMRILNRLGGIELASAYACIKAISKKKQDDHRRAARPSSSRARRSAGWRARRPRRSST